MANSEHVALVKQGRYAIARWRERHWRRRQLDLSGATFSRARLAGVDFSHDKLSEIDLTNADLRRADLSGANLQDAALSRANLAAADLAGVTLAGAALVRANLSGCRLTDVDLQGADLSFADLTNTDLSRADLANCDLTEANLAWANLSGANLRRAKLTATQLELANLSGVDLRGALLVRAGTFGTVLSEATLEMTLISDCDLSQVIGLESVHQLGPSIIGLDTLERSRGNIPARFLKQAGVSDSLIAVQQALRAAARPYSRVLLVSSRQDSEVVTRLLSGLQDTGLLCWSLLVDNEAAFQSDDAALQRCAFYDQLVLVCSAHSLENPHGWRFFEYLTHRGMTAGVRRLYPVALDDLIYTKEDSVCEALRHLPTLDFRGWQQEGSYQQSLENLVTALSAPGRPQAVSVED